MRKPILQSALLLCFAAGLAANTPATRAQVPSVPAVVPGFTSPLRGNYDGTAVWQQPDGTTLKGVIFLEVYHPATTAAATPASNLALSAQLYFGTPGSAPVRSFIFAGKLDPSGRGFLRQVGESVSGLPFSVPALDPGKVAVLISAARGVASGGVLAEDGAQLTFRAVQPVVTGQ